MQLSGNVRFLKVRNISARIVCIQLYFVGFQYRGINPVGYKSHENWNVSLFLVWRECNVHSNWNNTKISTTRWEEVTLFNRVIFPECQRRAFTSHTTNAPFTGWYSNLPQNIQNRKSKQGYGLTRHWTFFARGLLARQLCCTCSNATLLKPQYIPLCTIAQTLYKKHSFVLFHSKAHFNSSIFSNWLVSFVNTITVTTFPPAFPSSLSKQPVGAILPTVYSGYFPRQNLFSVSNQIPHQ